MRRLRVPISANRSHSRDATFLDGLKKVNARLRKELEKMNAERQIICQEIQRRLQKPLKKNSP